MSSRGKKRFLRRISGVILAIFLAFSLWDLSSTRIPIFGFHDIYDPNQKAAYQSSAPYLDYSAPDLEKILSQLVKENYWFLSSQEIDDYFISKRAEIPESRRRSRPIALSFDDSYESVHTLVLPIVQKIYRQSGVKIPLILFLNSGRMEEEKAKSSSNKSRYLTCDEIRQGFADGFYDVQSAGKDHLILTREKDSVVDSDVQQSQQWLRQCLNIDEPNTTVARHFSYPYNRLNRRVEKRVSQFHDTAYLYDKRLQRMGWTTRGYRVSRVGIRRKTPRWKIMGEAHRASKLS